MNLNKAFILGNVTRIPDVRSLPSGQSVTSFSIATNRFYTDSAGAKKQEADFHNIVAFGKLADICSRFLTKGSMVLVEGRIKTRSWLNPAGVKQYKTEIIATNIQLGPRTTGESVPKPLEEGKNEEIPIIEENYKPGNNTSPKEVSEPSPETFPQNDEINIKDIPF